MILQPIARGVQRHSSCTVPHSALTTNHCINTQATQQTTHRPLKTNPHVKPSGERWGDEVPDPDMDGSQRMDNCLPTQAASGEAVAPRSPQSLKPLLLSRKASRTNEIVPPFH
mmetsp:Transcript_50892/g.85048  ORF Transcript_50892/g.85048 Transcript_50892/m.85048 type:complete len:113 (-) Transcript_50892:629-967(-)